MKIEFRVQYLALIGGVMKTAGGDTTSRIRNFTFSLSIPSYRVDFKFIDRVVGYSHDIYVTIAPAYHVVWSPCR